MIVATRLRDFLCRSLSSFPWPIAFQDWEGCSYRVGGQAEHWCGEPLAVTFKTERAGQDLLALNGLGVLECFLRGDVDLAGNLYALPLLKQYMKLDLSYPRLLVALSKNLLAETVERARVNVSSHYDIPQAVLDIYLDRAYLSYSCGLFEDPSSRERESLTRAGEGEKDQFDSLEKAQWRKFKDAVDFIDPKPGETMLDVGCGYGGQLIVALETHPFGKVVGCTHSHNQALVGRRWLEPFAPEQWELRESDYRKDDRVFDHVTSTGMISHVGPRGLVPYVRQVRQRIRTGGRYLHHALMTPYRRWPIDRSPGIAFNKKYVWPGFHWFTLSEHMAALERNGFHVIRAVDLSPHYAKTTAAWYERLIERQEEALGHINTETFRAWQVYLAGCSGSFLCRDSLVYRLYCEAV